MVSLLSLVLFARKYETPLHFELAADSLTDHLLRLCYVNALGIAIIAKHPPLAKRAFAAWDSAFKNEVEGDPNAPQWLDQSLQTLLPADISWEGDGEDDCYVPGKVFVGWRPERVSDMREELVEAIPLQSFLALLRLETAVYHHIGSNWSINGAQFTRDFVTK